MFKENISKLITYTLLIVNCLLPAFSFGQTIHTFIDKKDILIGEQIKYKVKVTFPKNSFAINWFNLPDTISHFEVIDKTGIDSIVERDQTVLTQTITYTSFDSGKWALPSLLVQARALENDSAIQLKTDTFSINVLYAPDSTKQLRDIKPIMEVTVTNYFWYYVAGAALLLILISLVIWRYFKKRKKPAVNVVNTLSAYDEAVQALQLLDNKNLVESEALKQYHADLSVIFKRYFSRMAGKNMLNHTTGDTLIQLSIAGIAKDEIAAIAVALRCGDAVKFAKFKPAIYESENSKLIISEAINTLNRYFNNNKL